MISVEPEPGHVVAFLDKTLYNHYLCLAAIGSFKQAGNRREKKSNINIGKLGIRSIPKRARICRKYKRPWSFLFNG